MTNPQDIIGREIKFRAWDKKWSKMHAPNDVALKGDGTIGAGLDDQMVLLQYTNLKDKNGKEIYEGDIVTYWCIRKKGRDSRPSDIGRATRSWTKVITWNMKLRCPTEKLEVIGNVFEHPHLLDD